MLHVSNTTGREWGEKKMEEKEEKKEKKMEKKQAELKEKKMAEEQLSDAVKKFEKAVVVISCKLVKIGYYSRHLKSDGSDFMAQYAKANEEFHDAISIAEKLFAEAESLFNRAENQPDICKVWFQDIKVRLDESKTSLDIVSKSEMVKKMEEKMENKMERENLECTFNRNERDFEYSLPMVKVGETYHITITPMVNEMSEECDCKLLQCYLILQELFKGHGMMLSETAETISVPAGRDVPICESIKQVFTTMLNLAHECTSGCIHDYCDVPGTDSCRHTGILDRPANDELYLTTGGVLHEEH